MDLKCSLCLDTAGGWYIIIQIIISEEVRHFDWPSVSISSTKLGDISASELEGFTQVQDLFCVKHGWCRSNTINWPQLCWCQILHCIFMLLSFLSTQIYIAHGNISFTDCAELQRALKRAMPDKFSHQNDCYCWTHWLLRMCCTFWGKHLFPWCHLKCCQQLPTIPIHTLLCFKAP